MARRTIATWAGIGCALLAGCEQRSAPQEVTNKLDADNKQGAGFIAFVAARQDNPLWPIIRRGAERYASLVDAMEIRFFVPAGNSPQHEVTLLNALNDPKMAGLCVEAADADVLIPPLRHIQARGVHIVSMLGSLPLDMRVGQVSFNDTDIGTALADATAQAISEKGSIMLLHGDTQAQSQATRLVGFEEQLKRYPHIELFASIQCRKGPLEARQIIRERSQRFPRLSAWVALEDWPLCELAADEQPLPLGMHLITVGGLPEQWPLIKKGMVPAVVAANYHEVGYKAASFCEVAVRHRSRTKNLYEIPLRIVTSNNLDEYIRDWTTWTSGQLPQITPLDQPR